MAKNYRKDVMAATTDAIDWTIDISGPFDLRRIALAFATSPTTSEDLTVTIQRSEGAPYNTVLRSSDMQGVSSLTLENLGPVHKDDDVLVEYANTDGVSINGIATVEI